MKVDGKWIQTELRPGILDMIPIQRDLNENGWTNLNRGETNSILRYVKYLECWRAQAIETYSALEDMVVSDRLVGR